MRKTYLIFYHTCAGFRHLPDISELKAEKAVFFCINDRLGKLGSHPRSIPAPRNAMTVPVFVCLLCFLSFEILLK